MVTLWKLLLTIQISGATYETASKTNAGTTRTSPTTVRMVDRGGAGRIIVGCMRGSVLPGQDRGDALAAGRADRDEPAPAALLGEELGQRGHDPPAGRRERVTSGERRTVHVELRPVDRPQWSVEAEPALGERRVLPGLERRQYLRRKRLVNLVEVEVWQRQPGSGEQPGYRVHRRGEQSLTAVDEVDGGRLGGFEVRENRQSMGNRPFLAGQQRHGGAIGERRGVAGGHRCVRSPAE